MEQDSPIFPGIGIFTEPAPRSGPLRLLEYDVLIHLDRVIDYRDSGHQEWRYKWQLRREDGALTPSTRGPVHSRLIFPPGNDDDGDASAGGGGDGGGQVGGSAGRMDRIGGLPATAPLGHGGSGGRHGRNAVGGAPVSPPVSGGRAPELTGSIGNSCSSADEVVPEAACPPSDNLGMAAQSLDREVGLALAPVLASQDAGDRLRRDSYVAPVHPSVAGVLHDCASVDHSLGLGLDTDSGPTRGAPPALVIGPPCATLGPSPAIGLGARSSATEGDGLAEALSAFLLAASLPSPPALLSTPDPQLPPPPSPQTGTVAALPPTPPPTPVVALPPTPVAAVADAGAPRCSGRLAAKPTRGLSAEEKARLVLLKRSGIVLHDGPPEAEELERYRLLYSKELPDSFIQAVSALVAATSSKFKNARDQAACT